LFASNANIPQSCHKGERGNLTGVNDDDGLRSERPPTSLGPEGRKLGSLGTSSNLRNAGFSSYCAEFMDQMSHNSEGNKVWRRKFRKRSKNWRRKTERDFESGLMLRMWKKPTSCSRYRRRIRSEETSAPSVSKRFVLGQEMGYEVRLSEGARRPKRNRCEYRSRQSFSRREARR
jgi:hypothetical protein